MKIILADDHGVVRAGCRRLLEAEPYITIIDEAGSSEQLLKLISHEEYNVIILDLSLPVCGGMECLKRVLRKRPKIKILIFTIYDNSLLVERCMQAGAMAYVTKASDPSELLTALISLNRNEIYLSKDITRTLAIQKLRRQDTDLSSLSPRELEIFLRVSSGDNTKRIAKDLFIADKTVSNYISRIKIKLKADSTAKWVHIALENNLINKNNNYTETTT